MRRARHAAARPTTALVLVDRIERAIFVVRGDRVMLDADLARLYGVRTKALVQAVKRNAARFPSDFMIELTARETAALRSQIVTSNRSSARGGRRYSPYAFTEQGVAMLSSVLRSERAIRVNVQIVRAFVRLRRVLASHADLARKLAELERKYDGRFAVVFEALRDITQPQPARDVPRRQIGFRTAADNRPDRHPAGQSPVVRPRALSRVTSPPAGAGCASTRPASRRRRRR